MSIIGAALLVIFLITGIMLVAESYKNIGLSKNAWIAINLVIFVLMISYEIFHKIKNKGDEVEGQGKE